MFVDRKDAGEKLAKSLKKYERKDVIVLAIPRGGTEVGYEVAKELGARFNLLVTRKLPYPYNPESGFGAIAEDGTLIFVSKPFSDQRIQEIIEEQEEEIKERIDKLRKKSLPNFEDQILILVDDGIATGSTMKAAVEYCKKRNPKKIVVASPVSSERVRKEFDESVDEVVVLETPMNFRAVAQVYENWYDVSDEEVLEIMNKWNSSGNYLNS